MRAFAAKMEKTFYMRFLIPLIGIQLLPNRAEAQIDEAIVIPQTPTVGNLMSYVDRPVSYYSGTTSVNVPLCEVTAYEVSLPISLSYYSTGCQPAQEASWVGLGWNMSLNACISRRVKCFDDFNEYDYPGLSVRTGYYESGPAPTSLSINNNYFEFVSRSSYYSVLDRNIDVAFPQLIKDSEADVYSFSFWGGSGKFILGSGTSEEAQFFDKSEGWKAHIENDTSSGGYVFILTSKDGTKYEFRKREVSRNYSHNEGSTATNEQDKNENSFLELPVRYASSWFLTKIITPTLHEIDFEYQRETYSAPSQEGCTRYYNYRVDGVGCCRDPYTYPTQYYISKSVFSTYRLSRIHWANGDITFHTSQRQDMKMTDYPVHKLDSIVVHDSQNNRIRGFELIYGYFNTTSTGSYNYLDKRLRLERVREISSPQNQYKFAYSDGVMPRKNTKDVDYWGYYNGRNYGSAFYCAAYNTANNRICEGAIKNSSLTYSKIGMLSSITHPTGGVETFEYELNSFDGAGSWTSVEGRSVSGALRAYNIASAGNNNYLPTTDTVSVVTSGHCVLRIRGAYHLAGTPSNTTYDNTLLDVRQNTTVLGSITASPDHMNFRNGEELTLMVELNAGSYKIIAHRPPQGYMSEWHYELEDYRLPSSEPIQIAGAGLRIKRIVGGGKTRNFSYTTGTLLIEPCVSYYFNETCPDGGTMFYYLVQQSEPSLPCSTLSTGNIVGYSLVSESDGLVRTDYEYSAEKEIPYGTPFVASQPNFKNGRLLAVKSYDGNTLVAKKVYNYSEPQSTVMQGFYYKPYSGHLEQYFYPVKFNLVGTETELQYSDGLTYSSPKQYYYNSRYMLSQENMYIDGTSHSSVITYTCDRTDDTNCQNMTNLNMLLPVEVSRKVGSAVIGGTKMEYSLAGGIYLPRKIYELDARATTTVAGGSSQYEETVSYDSYYSHGCVKQVTRNGVPTTYIWSYNGEYPVAEIVNATFSSVLSALNGVTPEQLFNRGVPTATDFTALRNLRMQLPHSAVTVYSYEPLRGVSSITAPNGVTTYYRYDVQGRLAETYYLMNGSHQTIQRYDYHLSGN